MSCSSSSFTSRPTASFRSARKDCSGDEDEDEVATATVIIEGDDSCPSSPHLTSASSSIPVLTRLFAQQNLHDIPKTVLERVSPKDRESSLYEIHGVLPPCQEEAESDEGGMWISSKVQALKDYLNSRDAHNIGIEKQSEPELFSFAELQEWFQTTPADFMEEQLIAILRTEQWDIRKAATRLLRHLHFKSKLFSPESLNRPLKWDDLQPSDRNLIWEGGIQWIDHPRDRSGRPMVTQFHVVTRTYPVDSLMRVYFWLVAVAVRQDVEAQRRGFVFTYYAVTDVFSRKRDRGDRPYMRMMAALAARIAALHLCFVDRSNADYVNKIGNYFEASLMIRLASHFGNHIECQNNLMTFGIPSEAIRINPDNGAIRTQAQHVWLSQFQQTDSIIKLGKDGGKTTNKDSTDTCVSASKSSSNEHVKSPGPQDVVCGRGKRGTKSQGNSMLRRLVEDYYEKYNQSSRIGKTQISQRIYQRMIDTGCRFLEPVFAPNGPTLNGRPVPIGYRDIEVSSAHERITHGLRNMRQASEKPDSVSVLLSLLQQHKYFLFYMLSA